MTPKKNIPSLTSKLDFEKIFGSSRIPFMILNPEGTLIDCNEEYLNIFGFKEKQLVINRPLHSFYENCDRNKVDENINKILDTGYLKNIELIQNPTTGKQQVVEFISQLINDDEGSPQYIFSSANYLSNDEDLIGKINDTDVHLKTMLERLPSAVFVCRMDKNRSLKKFGGNLIASDHSKVAYEKGLMEIIHQEDKERVRKYLTGNNPDNEEYIIDYRIAVSRDKYKWVSESGIFTRDGSGYTRGIISDIHERKEHEISLGRQLNIIKKLNELSGAILIICDFTGSIEIASHGAAKVTGYSIEELSSRNFFDLLFDFDDKKSFIQLIENLIVSDYGKKTRINTTLLDKRKKRKLVGLEVMVLSGETEGSKKVVISGFDVTPQLENVLQERRNEFIYKALIESIPGVDIFFYSETLDILLLEGMELIKHGYKKEELENRNIGEIFDEEIAINIIPVLELALSGTSGSNSFSIGSSNYLLQAVPFRDGNEKISGGVGILQNITERKKNEENIERAKRIAEKASNAKSDFLANISHEIRTPLNSIIGFTEQMNNTKLSVQQERFLQYIRHSSGHLLSLLDDTITLRRIEKNEIEVNRHTFLLRETVIDVYNMLKVQAARKGLVLEYSVDKQLGIPLISDSLLIKQILIILTRNAIKFTEQGKINIECKCLFKKKDQYNVRMSVNDTGIGVSTKRIGKIFSEFEQGDISMTKKFGGSGIGLTICKQYADMLGGKINVESKDGKGSRFTVDLILNAARIDAIETEEKENIDLSFLKNKSVLVVDDDEMNRLLINSILQNWGVKSSTAENGKETLKMLKREQFDLVLLDMHMPDISGIEVARHIRKYYYSSILKVRILAVSANVVKSHVKKFMEAGVDDYLAKPFTENELATKICKIFGVFGYEKNKESKMIDNDKKEKLNLSYSLKQLHYSTRNDPVLMKKMLRIFIDQNKKDMLLINKYLEDENWHMIGETAHRMKNSFGHIQVRPLYDYLIDIEEFTKNRRGNEMIKSLIGELNKHTPDLFRELENKLDNI